MSGEFFLHYFKRLYLKMMLTYNLIFLVWNLGEQPAARRTNATSDISFGVHSLSRIIPKTLKTGIYSFLAWRSA